MKLEEQFYLNNYDKLTLGWEKKFVTQDKEKLLKILPELKDEGDRITFLYFNQPYYIEKATGVIYSFDESEIMTNVTKMNMYTFFWYAKEEAKLKNNWLPFRLVKGAGPFTQAFQNSVLNPLAMTFEGHLKEFCQACEKLNGEKISFGDAGYVIKAFECAPLQVILWDGDDEFSAEGNILFDESIVDFVHVESTVTLACDVLSYLAKAAGLPIKGKSFFM